MTVYEYRTHPTTGTVHLIDRDGMLMTGIRVELTLCGERVYDRWRRIGGETITGVAATCRRCRRSLLLR